MVPGDCHGDSAAPIGIGEQWLTKSDLGGLMKEADQVIRPKRDFTLIAGSLSSQEASDLDDTVRDQRVAVLYYEKDSSEQPPT